MEYCFICGRLVALIILMCVKVLVVHTDFVGTHSNGGIHGSIKYGPI